MDRASTSKCRSYAAKFKLNAVQLAPTSKKKEIEQMHGSQTRGDQTRGVKTRIYFIFYAKAETYAKTGNQVPIGEKKRLKNLDF